MSKYSRCVSVAANAIAGALYGEDGREVTVIDGVESVELTAEEKAFVVRTAEHVVRHLHELGVDVKPQRSARGLFTHFGDVPSSYGGYIRAYESSAAGHPHIWVMCECPVSLNEPEGPTKDAVAHLTIENAAELRDQLDYLIENHYQNTKE